MNIYHNDNSMINRKGERVHVYDTVEARFVDEGDLILLDGDQIEVNQKIDSGEVIMFKGVSFIEGDNVERIVDASRPIDLWTEDA